MLFVVFAFFFEKHSTDVDAHKHARKDTPMNVHPADLEFDEVTTGVSLLTGTSPTTKRIAPIKFCIS